MKYCCAGIVLYNPEIDRLKENITAIENQVDSIIIVDNNSLNADSMLSGYSESEKFIVIKNKKNVGIAAALNQICEESLRADYEWVLLLDQDSICSANMVDSYSKYVEDEAVALLTPYIIDINKLTVEEYLKLNLPEISEVEWAITSGSAVRLSTWRKAGGFDEELFIDGVDIDYSTRLKINGYKQLRINREYLLQEVGRAEPTFIRRIHKDNACSITIKRYYRSNHSLLRQYYMTRNGIIIARKYKSYKFLLKGIMRTIMIALPKLLVEKNKRELFKTLLNGFYDGFKYQIVEYKKTEKKV